MIYLTREKHIFDTKLLQYIQEQAKDGFLNIKKKDLSQIFNVKVVYITLSLKRLQIGHQLYVSPQGSGGINIYMPESKDWPVFSKHLPPKEIFGVGH